MDAQRSRLWFTRRKPGSAWSRVNKERVERLEAKGLVRRERCASDRRQVLCRIAPAGLALLAKLDAPVIEADRAAMGGLTTAETRQLIRLLEKIRESHG